MVFPDDQIHYRLCKRHCGLLKMTLPISFVSLHTLPDPSKWYHLLSSQPMLATCFQHWHLLPGGTLLITLQGPSLVATPSIPSWLPYNSTCPPTPLNHAILLMPFLGLLYYGPLSLLPRGRWQAPPSGASTGPCLLEILNICWTVKKIMYVFL